MRRCVVCHYGEIALKGKNRSFFEKKLVLNIKEMVNDAEVQASRGRVVVFSEDEFLEEKLKKIPGIVYFSLAEKVSSSLPVIKERAVSLIEKESFEKFAVRVKRADKSFPVSSMDCAREIGNEIAIKTKKKVDLTNPDITCFVEIAGQETYIYYKKIRGVGGIPIGTGGRAVSLISGGIDSPVASFRMIKRGVRNIFIHFHAYPATSKESISKVEQLVKTLSSFQGKSTLYLIPFNEIQKEIMINTLESLRVLLYRRFMMRIAQKIASKEKAKAVITGESMGQVASQTMENMAIAQGVLNIPILRPLISYDKEEIIKEASKINTYKTSILPEEDCCVRFLPKNPKTKGNIFDVKKEEKKLNAENLVKEAIFKAEKRTIS